MTGFSLQVHFVWDMELNFRHIKTTLGMELMRTKTPGMVRKEMTAYMVAYNLIRTLMWEAGEAHEVDALRISFKGTLQHLSEMAPRMEGASAREHSRMYRELLRILSREVVPERPGRVEPRVRKRRPKNYRLMTRPRDVLRKELLR